MTTLGVEEMAQETTKTEDITGAASAGKGWWAEQRDCKASSQIWKALLLLFRWSDVLEKLLSEITPERSTISVVRTWSKLFCACLRLINKSFKIFSLEIRGFYSNSVYFMFQWKLNFCNRWKLSCKAGSLFQMLFCNHFPCNLFLQLGFLILGGLVGFLDFGWFFPPLQLSIACNQNPDSTLQIIIVGEFYHRGLADLLCLHLSSLLR